MRKYSLTLLAGVAVGLAAIQAASAADLPRKAPAYVPPAPPPFSWTGFYGGIHAGWGWSNSSASVLDTALLFDPISIGQNGNGVIGGAQIGYNWQFSPNFVLGIEGDISGTGIRNTTSAPMTFGGGAVPGTTQAAERDIRWLATVRGRLGYAADRWLFYVTGGGAWGEVDYSGGPTFFGVYTGPVSFNHTSSGWTVGGGVEYAFTNNWTGRLEYLYYDLNGATLTVPAIGGGAATQIWDDNKINVVRAAVNYKF